MPAAGSLYSQTLRNSESPRRIANLKLKTVASMFDGVVETVPPAENIDTLPNVERIVLETCPKCNFRSTEDIQDSAILHSSCVLFDIFFEV